MVPKMLLLLYFLLPQLDMIDTMQVHSWLTIACTDTLLDDLTK